MPEQDYQQRVWVNVEDEDAWALALVEEDLGRDLRRNQISRRYWLISTPAATSSACDFAHDPWTPL